MTKLKQFEVGQAFRKEIEVGIGNEYFFSIITLLFTFPLTQVGLHSAW